jgi:CrcB protein
VERRKIDSEAGGERYPARRPFDVRELAFVFAGGVLGALARGGLAQALPTARGGWPWATFAVNMLGAALLGYAAARLAGRAEPNPRARAFLAGGICGTLTTFSALMLELLRMLDGAHVALALAYLAASVGAGLALVFAAGAAGRRHAARRPAGETA